MKIKFSLLFFAGGIFLISLAGIEWYTSKQQQEKALEMAKEYVQESNEKKSPERISASEQSLLAESVTVVNQDVIGVIKIPALKDELPIVEGITDQALKKGVGHYTGTAFPDQNDQIVLSGHRETVFKNLGRVKVGDEVILEMANGKFTYIIEETFIVEADDLTVIKSTAPNEVLTLTTCYPFNYIGDAPQRFIVNAKRKL